MERISLCPACAACPEVVIEGDHPHWRGREHSRPPESGVERASRCHQVRPTRPSVIAREALAGRQRSPDASTSKLRHCRSVRILEGLDRIPYTGNVMSCRRVLSLLLLAAWVLIGPMAIAFGGCAATAASCHLACTPLACPTVVQAMAPEALA